MNQQTRRDAWFPFYVGDYLRDTGRLTTEAHGAYLLLLCDYWTMAKPLPDDNDQLAAITRLPPEKWVKLRPILAGFFKVDGGLWRHKRVEIELQRAKSISRSRAKAGSQGAETRWQADLLDDGKPDSKAMANASQNDAPSQSPSPKKDIMSEKDFDTFWSAVPSYRKVSKRQALKAFLSAARRSAPDALSLGHAFAAHCQRKGEYAQHPATWLNADGWLDQAVKANGSGNAEDQQMKQWRARVGNFVRHKLWQEDLWGPKPGAPGCKAPPEIVAELMPHGGSA